MELEWNWEGAAPPGQLGTIPLNSSPTSSCCQDWRCLTFLQAQNRKTEDKEALTVNAILLLLLAMPENNLHSSRSISPSPQTSMYQEHLSSSRWASMNPRARILPSRWHSSPFSTIWYIPHPTDPNYLPSLQLHILHLPGTCIRASAVVVSLLSAARVTFSCHPWNICIYLKNKNSPFSKLNE
jgi:hypothetical protein